MDSLDKVRELFSGNIRLMDAAPDLLECVTELRNVTVAMFRAIQDSDASLIARLDQQFTAAGIKTGFVARADSAIARSTDSQNAHVLPQGDS